MTTFRYKPDKIKYLTSINTLDTVHRKYVCEFESRRKKINDLKTEISTIENQLVQLAKPIQSNDQNISNDIKYRSDLKTRLQKIRRDLFDIENNISELEYYSQTNDILLDYYNETTPYEPFNQSDNVDYSPSSDMDPVDQNIENHFKIVNEIDGEIQISQPVKDVDGKLKLEELNLISQLKRKPKKVTRRRVRKTDIVNNKCILDFFSDKPITTATQDTNTMESIEETEEVEEIVGKVTETVDEIKEKESIEQLVSNKATLFDDYMTLVDKTYTSREKKNVIRTCTKCDVEKTLIQSEGFYVCQKCGEVEHAIIESEIPSHKDSVTEKNKYPYKRLNHLTEYPRICIEKRIESILNILIFVL